MFVCCEQPALHGWFIWRILLWIQSPVICPLTNRHSHVGRGCRTIFRTMISFVSVSNILQRHHMLNNLMSCVQICLNFFPLRELACLSREPYSHHSHPSEIWSSVDDFRLGCGQIPLNQSITPTLISHAVWLVHDEMCYVHRVLPISHYSTCQECSIAAWSTLAENIYAAFAAAPTPKEVLL
jgi:hypothetical protein